MTPIDTRANVDFQRAFDLHLNLPKFQGPDAESASRPVDIKYGGNVGSVSNIGNTTSIGTTGNFVNQDVNGILSGSAWDIAGGDTLTFSFPSKGAFYGSGYGSNEPASGFTAFTGAQKEVVRFALDLISQYTGINFQEIKETDSAHATLRFAGSSVPSTSWAYYPAGSTEAGDVWLGNIKDQAPTKAGYAFDTILHEIGHTMGLKHGQQDDGVHGVLPDDHNSTEWSLMSYHSFVGGDDYYRNIAGSGNQSYMIDDIAALQYMYGANYNTESGKTVYTWSKSTGEFFINGVGQGASETNKIYEAIWDGGGKDVYDLSKYSSDLHINLNPGEWSTFSSGQLADLDVSNPGLHLAPGNISNAHLFENDRHSLIEQAFGGLGDDEIIGNVGKNLLRGGKGDDHLSGLDGKDVLDGGKGQDVLSGGAGKDTFLFHSIKDSTRNHADSIIDLDRSDTIDVSAVDADTTLDGNQDFTLVGKFHHAAGEATLSYDSGTDTTSLSFDVDGDAVADMVIAISGDWHNFRSFEGILT